MSPPWRLEPDALIPGVTISDDLQTQHLDVAVPLSIAISLKRIADTLDGTTGLSIAQAIENAIGTGMFHGFQNMKG